MGGLEGARFRRAAGERGFLFDRSAIAFKNAEPRRFNESSSQSCKLIPSNWSAQMKTNISHVSYLVCLA
jgi:hypothetical protein